MRLSTVLKMTMATAVVIPFSGFAQERADLFEFHNRLRVEYDDNVRQSKVAKQDSLKLIEEAEFVVNFDSQGTYIGLRYQPSFVWWEDRDEDETDLHHQLDANLSHDFSDRLSLSVKELFRLAEQPELQQEGEGAVVRENNDFIYNSLNAGLTGQIVENTIGVIDVRHALVAYEDSDVGADNDYDQLVIGGDIRHQLQPEMTVEGQLRYNTTDYEDNLRGSESVQIGGKVSRVFSPQMQGNVRLGYESKSFDSAGVEDTDTPYIDAGLVFVVSNSTRINAGLGWGQAQTPTSKFATQDRTSVYVGLAQDVSNRLSINGSVGYTTGDFSADEATSAFNPATDSTGTEDVVRASLRGSYMLNRSNWLEFGVQYVDLTSDIRPASEFDRTRVNLGWRTQL